MLTDAPPESGPRRPLRQLQTKYYVMHTDVPDDLAREAGVRLDRMFEEYAQRTSGFSKATDRRLPFYLFSRPQEYYAAGGMKGTAGVFMVRGNDARLMGMVMPDGATWHVVQHEGFHQFAFLSIAQNLPMWVNEGLAEYFGEAKFTGDNMVSGLVPEGRRQRVVRMIEDRRHAGFAAFKSVSMDQWNREMKVENYDQAWSMVQFLAEGEGGRYQKAFLAYMQALARGQDNERAWNDAFGAASTQGFEQAWRKYWTELPENPTEKLYAQARMMTLASFLARSKAAGQAWNSARDFTMAARKNEVRMSGDPKVWLPPSLLTEALDEAGDDAALRLTGTGNAPRLTRQYPDGTTVTVSFTMAGDKPRTVAEVKAAGRKRGATGP